VDEPGRAELVPQLALRLQPSEEPIERPVELRSCSPERRWTGERDGQDICLHLLRRNRLDLHSHGGAMLADAPPTLPRMRGIQLCRPGADRRPVASGTTLTHLRPARFRRSRSRSTADLLTQRIALLVAERQQLRVRGAAPAALERNRLQIARAQWELAHALIDQHLPEPIAESAA
jgi:hypothetical protein